MTNPPYAVSAMELLGRWLAVAYEEPENFTTPAGRA